MKIITVVGARPQFIKAAAVSRALRERAIFEEVMVHTGQHFDHNMSQVFFDELDLAAPQYNLGVGGGSHAENTGRAMEGLEKVVAQVRPKIVLVYGDTDSTLAGALVAAKAGIPLAHVEAGLRSFNRRMPEEINRVLTDHVSALLFATSDIAVRNLAAEGISGDRVVLVGDVMYDAVRLFSQRAIERSSVLSRLGLKSRGYVLATIHRKENTDDPVRLANIIGGLQSSGKTVVLPLHPRTRRRLAEFGMEGLPGLVVIEPVGYLDMLRLAGSAAAIATDSGGLQKEAYFHRVPCVILREETEWVELVEMGAAEIVGADRWQIANALQRTRVPAKWLELYGDGHSADRIAGILAEHAEGFEA